jgi:brefeldin A-resistance guanine nucleotide exchange factor 1
LELDALSAALRALVVLADRRTVDKLQFLDTGDPATSPRSPREPAQLPYDAAAIFLLETMVSIASKTKEWIEDTWLVFRRVATGTYLITFHPRPIVFDYLSRLLSVANRFGILLIDRAVAGLLRLSLIVAEKVNPLLSADRAHCLHHDSGLQSTLRDQLYVALDVLGGLPPTVFGSVAEQIIAGVAEILKGQKAVIR